MRCISLSFCLVAMLTILGCGPDDSETIACDACVGTSLGPDGSNPAVSCTAATEPNTCTCLDEMGESQTVYISEGSCF
ncbi:MAG TPA: hypothetical protein VLS88_02380 [Polyangiales bacterium]|nr:hypothetical protein [Polyangiales bacterium]